MATLRWKKVRAGVYHAISPWGLYIIDGEGYGRNRWTVTYPGGDYGMVDALAEAKAWAEQDADARAKRGSSHAAKKTDIDPRTVGLVEEAAYAVAERPGSEDLTKEEFHEEVLGLLTGLRSSAVDRLIDRLYDHVQGSPSRPFRY